MRRRSISDEFLDGILEVYEELGSRTIELLLLDDELTEVDDFYRETETQRTYLDPILLTGRVQYRTAEGKEVIEESGDYVSVIIPSKSLVDNNLPIDLGSLELYRRAAFRYQGLKFEVEEVVPSSSVDDTFQIM